MMHAGPDVTISALLGNHMTVPIEKQAIMRWNLGKKTAHNESANAQNTQAKKEERRRCCGETIPFREKKITVGR